MKKVFISYSHNNTQEKEELKKHLTVLERKGLIDSWDDSEIETGVQWRETILAELKSSNVIIFLVSSDFLASNFINDVEIKEAIELNKQGDIEIFPVILNDCLWKETFLGTVQALPLDENRRLKPISGWDDKNEAFFKVSESILNSLNKDKSKAKGDNPDQNKKEGVGNLESTDQTDRKRKKRGISCTVILLALAITLFAAWKIVPGLIGNLGDENMNEILTSREVTDDSPTPIMENNGSDDNDGLNEIMPNTDIIDDGNGTDLEDDPTDGNETNQQDVPTDENPVITVKSALSIEIVKFLSDNDNRCYSVAGVRNIGGRSSNYPDIRDYSEAQIKSELETLIELGIATHNCSDTRSYRIVLDQPELVVDYLGNN